MAKDWELTWDDEQLHGGDGRRRADGHPER